MLAIARYALKSPWHAAATVASLAILSLFIPLISILSGAIVGLIILTQGLLSGTRVILVSIVGVTAAGFLMTQSLILGVSIGLVQWLPMMLLAETLRRSRSLSLTLLVGMGMALVVVALQYLLFPNSGELWTQLLLEMLNAQQQAGPEMARFEQILEQMVHWMVIMLVAVMYATFIATLLAARWFQSRLAESDGYREEFYAIRLGQSAAILALLLSVASMLIAADWLLAMAMVVLTTFLYQGLAIVHSWSRAKETKSWLVLTYILMVIFPQVVVGVATLGMIDNWLDFRKKWKNLPTKTD
ncbi:MAG: DUF2232 domain-containing protein [Gammaproteobacteria bacterium]|nr:DUF2232 domain-containing protein [Gammaproteobacteria bacterium]